MKKIIIASAVLLAGIFTSCGNTNYCYEITASYKLFGQEISTTHYVWGTSNELDIELDNIKTELEKIDLPEGTYEITYQRANKSQSDCQ